jgi:hypothetical protein
MLDYFLVFVCGAVVMRVLQVLIGITPNYYIFKQAEFAAIKTLAELHICKLTVMKIVEICYRDVDKLNEYYVVESEVNKRYNNIINNSIASIKANMPYKVEYSNLQEAVEVLMKEKKDGR